MTPRKSSRPKSERSPAKRGKPPVIDTLLQSATVAVFHACGVALAPLTPTKISTEELELEFPVGVMAFKGPHIDCALILSLPKKVCERLDMGRKVQSDARDLLRELTNLIVGRLKNRLTLYQVAITNGLPICRDRRTELDTLLGKPGALTAYRFRTLDGTALLVLKGSIDESRLVYSSNIFINAEGDIILF